MNPNRTKYGYSRSDSPTKEVLIAKGIEQAWRRRFSYNIRSGVRVKVQRKNSVFIKPIQQQLQRESKSVLLNPANRIQSMLKRLWIESETSALSQNGQTSKNELLTSYQTKPILNDSFLGKNHSLRSYLEDKNVNSIGIQTTVIPKIDQQTSCDIITPTSTLIRRSHKSRSSSSSSTSVSETSVSDENLTHTDDTSTKTSEGSSTISGTKENEDYNTQYRRNKNRNNNAFNNGIEQKNNHIEMEKTKTQLANTKQSLQNININQPRYSQSTLSPVTSAEKKRFFSTFLHLFSFLRLSSFKRDRICIPTTTKTIRPPTSRCRRSAARNFNSNSSIQPEKDIFQIKSEENLEQKASIHYISDASMLPRKQYRQTNNSSLSIVDSHTNLRKGLSRRSNKTNRRKRSHRKENPSNRHHKQKYLHRKKQKYIRSSKKTLSTPSVAIEIQPLSSVDDQSKHLKSSVCNINCPDNTRLSLDKEIKQISLILPDLENKQPQREILPLQPKQDLSLQNVDNLSPCTTINSMFKYNILPSSIDTKRNNCKQHSSPATNSIHLRVKNKNLISTLSKSEIPVPSIYHVDDSIHSHQMNIVNEFKSLLRQTKHIHINNNALDDDDDPTIDTKQILTSSKSNPRSFSIKNQNQNKHPRASILSSDSQSVSTKTDPIHIHQVIPDQNEIIQEGIEQLIRYQKYAEQYKFKSNKTVKQFLLKSTALSSESLYKLSINNETHST